MARAGRGYSVHKSEALVCERDASRLVNDVIVFRTLYYSRPTGPPFSIGIFIEYHVYHTCVATRKNITIRDDQEEWVQDNHLNLSRFVQDKLDELIKERE